MNLLPNISPKLFTLSATTIGFLLLDDLTANEQNALGNWLMLVAQVLCTNGFYRQVIEERKQNQNQNQSNTDPTYLMQKMVNALQKQIDELKNSSTS